MRNVKFLKIKIKVIKVIGGIGKFGMKKIK